MDDEAQATRSSAAGARSRRSTRALLIAAPLCVGALGACAQILDIEPWKPGGDGGAATQGTSATTMSSTGVGGAGGAGPECLEPCLIIQLENGFAWRLAVTDTDDSIYWAVDGSPGSVAKTTKAPGGRAITLDATGNDPDGLAVDDDHVWVSFYGSGQVDGVRRIPKAGGAYVPWEPCVTTVDVAVDANHVFYTSKGCDALKSSLFRRSKANAIDVAEAQSNGEFVNASQGYIALGANDVFWTDNENIMKAPKSDLSIPTQLIPFNQPPRAIAVGGKERSQLFYAIADSIFVTDLDGKNENTIAVGQLAATGDRVGLAADGEFVYWAADAKSAIGRWSEGKAPQSFASNETDAVAIALDATHVYWSRRDGSIWRKKK